jgi:8-oxo-dGTP diphosphatase
MPAWTARHDLRVGRGGRLRGEIGAGTQGRAPDVSGHLRAGKVRAPPEETAGRAGDLRQRHHCPKGGLHVRVRQVEIEVMQAAAADTEAAAVAPAPLVGKAPSDEPSVRRECRLFLEDCEQRGVASVALMPVDAGPAGMPLEACAKIMAQEALRLARRGGARPGRIILAHPESGGFEIVRSTVNGYLEHFLEVLLWGPLVTVDAIVETASGIVVIERSNPLFGFALPGGFVDYGESLEEAVSREVREETGLEVEHVRQFHTYSDPSRDPRFHTVSTVFTARSGGIPRAGDDAAALRVVRAEEIVDLAFAFDHGEILRAYLASRQTWSPT